MGDRCLKKKRKFWMFILFCSIICVGFSIVCLPKPGTPPNDPMGTGKGIFPGRVVWSHNSESTRWSGDVEKSFYWENKNTDYDTVKKMLDEVILSLTGTTSVKLAWQKIFQHFHKSPSREYQPGEKIAVKVNVNVQHAKTYEENNFNMATPQFIRALLHQMCREYHVRDEDMIFYDASRLWAPHFYEPPTGIGANFPNVSLVDNKGEKEYDTKVEKDDSTMVYLSKKDAPDFDKTKFPKILTQATYVMEIDGFKGHHMAGLTMSGKNWVGSIYRPGVECTSAGAGHWCPIDIHPYLNVSANEMATYSVLVDLLGHDDTGGKGLLFLSDGLYGAESENSIPPIKFASDPFNNWWSSSILASIDPIALDSVAFDILRNEPNVPYARVGCVDNFMHEGALANDPPSKTEYNPTGKHVLDSLGCHEHWNNEKEKKYSRNLGKDEGLELITHFH